MSNKPWINHKQMKCSEQDHHTPASLRFSGLFLTLRDIDSSTSVVLELSLLTLTKNYTNKSTFWSDINK